MQLSPDSGNIDEAIAELQAVARGEIRPDPGDLLELAIELFVATHFSLDARIERAQKQHRARRHLVHYRKLVKAAVLTA